MLQRREMAATIHHWPISLLPASSHQYISLAAPSSSILSSFPSIPTAIIPPPALTVSVSLTLSLPPSLPLTFYPLVINLPHHLSYLLSFFFQDTFLILPRGMNTAKVLLLWNSEERNTKNNNLVTFPFIPLSLGQITRRFARTRNKRQQHTTSREAVLFIHHFLTHLGFIRRNYPKEEVNERMNK